MVDRDNETISKQDIFNMMDSYKSNVEFNKELLESQVKILEQHDGIIINLNKFNDNQITISTHLETLIDKLTCHNTNCSSNKDEAVTTVKEGISKINNHHIESIKSHNILRISLITGSSIIASLIWIIYQMVDKFDKLDAISKQLGV